MIYQGSLRAALLACCIQESASAILRAVYLLQATMKGNPLAIHEPPPQLEDVGIDLARSNRIVGWISLVVGAGTGLILGLWSFNGPVPVPEWLGNYDEVSRRLARLGHIAFFGLGILNILVARELPRVALRRALARAASATMNFGNVFLPTTLFLAAAYQPCKYLMPIPAMSVFIALAIVAYGICRPAAS